MKDSRNPPSSTRRMSMRRVSRRCVARTPGRSQRVSIRRPQRDDVSIRGRQFGDARNVCNERSRIAVSWAEARDGCRTNPTSGLHARWPALVTQLVQNHDPGMTRDIDPVDTMSFTIDVRNRVAWPPKPPRTKCSLGHLTNPLRLRGGHYTRPPDHPFRMHLCAVHRIRDVRRTTPRWVHRRGAS